MLLYHEKVNIYGFHFEEHKVHTEDGYILTMFRIYGKVNEIEEEKRVNIKEVSYLFTDCLIVRLHSLRWMINSLCLLFLQITGNFIII